MNHSSEGEGRLPRSPCIGILTTDQKVWGSTPYGRTRFLGFRDDTVLRFCGATGITTPEWQFSVILIRTCIV
jgi:hypothetical protein